MEELKLTGNCMLGSRPLLNFDIKFDSNPHWQVMKTLFIDAFGTPRGHPKSKPFVDRVMSFFILNNNICKSFCLFCLLFIVHDLLLLYYIHIVLYSRGSKLSNIG